MALTSGIILRYFLQTRKIFTPPRSDLPKLHTYISSTPDLTTVSLRFCLPGYVKYHQWETTIGGLITHKLAANFIKITKEIFNLDFPSWSHNHWPFSPQWVSKESKPGDLLGNVRIPCNSQRRRTSHLIFVQFPCPGPVVPNLCWYIFVHESFGKIHHSSYMCVQMRVLMRCQSKDS